MSRKIERSSFLHVSSTLTRFEKQFLKQCTLEVEMYFWWKRLCTILGKILKTMYFGTPENGFFFCEQVLEALYFWASERQFCSTFRLAKILGTVYFWTPEGQFCISCTSARWITSELRHETMWPVRLVHRDDSCRVSAFYVQVLWSLRSVYINVKTHGWIDAKDRIASL